MTDQTDERAVQGAPVGGADAAGTPVDAPAGFDPGATQPAAPAVTQPASPQQVPQRTAPQQDPAPAAPAPTKDGGPRHAFPMDSLPDLRESNASDSDGFDAAGAQSRDEFTTVYDIIDQLEASLDEAKGSIFTPGMVKVDRDEFAGQLDELKKMLPVQLERASALMREAERRLESAQTQANAIVASAQSRAADMIKDANDQAQFLAGQENVTEIARQKARAILDQAQAKADRLTQGADKYCTTVMEGLQAQLGKLDRDVQAGLNVLYERQRTAGEQLPHLDNNDYPEG
ncbi:ATP synthase F0 subunit B [Bifidobacterium aerophilum]|uniref:Cell division protein n=1 Tax=Bifidobacterium aerophilum TaxID=1798155 RepID=A0A6N9Z6J1_9BIFI|nr:ATP synthase F0 subunit B [Bifidobacterium aerophilum]NEG90329.1 cell division protein [Bifidobacterium aerophilum]